MSWTADDIETWLGNCADRMTQSAPELNTLDGQLGDGDLGATLQKCAALMKAGLLGTAALPSDAFKTAAGACARASGSRRWRNSAQKASSDHCSTLSVNGTCR